MADSLEQVRVIDADTHLTERTTCGPSGRRHAGATACRTSPRSTAAPRGWSTARCSGAPGPAASSTATASRAGRSRVSTSGRSSRPTRPPTTRWPGSSSWTRSACGPRSSIPGVVGLGGQGLAELVTGRRAAHACASRSSTTPAPSSRPSRATGCCRWRCCPAWDIDACVREAHRAEQPRAARRQPHLRPAGPRRARPGRAAPGTRCGRRAAQPACRCTSTSGPASRR